MPSPAAADERGGRPSASPPLCTLNDLLWLLYLYPVRTMAAVAPAALLRVLGRVAEPVVQLHAREGRERATRWLVSAMGSRLSNDQARAIARRSIANSAWSLLDDLVLDHRSAARALRCTRLEGLPHLERARAAGRGVLLVSGHFCANQLAERHLATAGYPTLFVHNRRWSNGAEGRLGQRILRPRYNELKRRAHPDVVYVQDPECGLKIFQRLRGGGLVAVQLDGQPGTRALCIRSSAGAGDSRPASSTSRACPGAPSFPCSASVGARDS